MLAVFSVSRRRYNVGKRQKLKSLQRQYIYHTTENAKIKTRWLLLCNTSPNCQCSAV